MSTKQKKKKRDRGNPYPWEEWFSKKKFRVKKGTHYTCLTSSMAILIRQKLNKYEKEATVKIESDEKILVTML